ncbi:hypothetical protein [Streptomyces hoynatensis]|uniref:DUF732 domain-containing protein n=1 Tax=Streptomyces hoynatensis TaxID=1141874 RepID=A0A3A9ZF81_9ACTN|nr:hypothetical protein [Streptomyces hoynatensis]RKN45917.1 hypothetical protein D7294_05675 [Streptomyces hoynatensis]
MSGRARRAALPLLVAVLGLLAACGGGGDGGGEGGADGGHPEGAATAPAEPGGPAEGESPGADAGGGTADGVPDETLPEDELTPAEGEFTEEQREYLAGRVPEGVDPNAILALGSEACERVGYLARHDPQGAAAALREDEIPGAAEAVAHLCPEYADLLDEAGRGDAAGDEGARE